MLRLALVFVAASVPMAWAANVNVFDGDGKPVDDAVVSLVPTGAKATAPRKPALMSQRDQEFEPRVVALQAGAELTLSNDDRTRHHVYSYSAIKQFDAQQPSGSPPLKIIFDKPGAVPLGCNIHDRMLGFVVVLDTPYFAKTNSEGKADLGKVPDGAYRATIWHARLKAPANELSADVTVAGDEIKGLEVVLPLRGQNFPRPPRNGVAIEPGGVDVSHQADRLPDRVVDRRASHQSFYRLQRRL